LLARKWLHQQRQAINEEIVRLVAIKKLRAADDLTNTTALSRRKSILTDELITDAYVERFKDELKSLKAERLSVVLKKTRAEVGRVYHRISLKNAKKDVKTSAILSEGEFRIASLAAFLADTQGRGAKTPFIFDDPISSLDHVYEEATAQRLVRLSKSRQVIVFTHRLSLVGFLEKYAEKDNVKAEVVCLSRYVTGEVTDLPIEIKRTDRAVNTLLNERLARATKALEQGDTAYENEAKGLCHDIRVLIERVVEMDLLNGVVRRFQQDVNTKGKIHALAKITETDCKFIDDYMTKYSRYEHSQPDETPLPLPRPDEIEADLNAIKGFIDNIHGR
jgi:wobble nucleotide-excising tRNase